MAGYGGRQRLAQAALNAYGLPAARFTFLRQAGNTLFRVYEASPTSTDSSLTFTRRANTCCGYHQPGYQTTEAIQLELAWMAAMCREASLPVPQPVPALDGNLLVQVTIPGDTRAAQLFAPALVEGTLKPKKTSGLLTTAPRGGCWHGCIIFLRSGSHPQASRNENMIGMGCFGTIPGLAYRRVKPGRICHKHTSSPTRLSPAE